jgi:hypothetical protein
MCPTRSEDRTDSPCLAVPSTDAFRLLERLDVLRSRLRLLKAETGLRLNQAWPAPVKAIAQSCLAYEASMPSGSVDWDLVQSRLIELCSAAPALFGDDVDRTLRVENPEARNSLNFFWPAHSSKPYRGSVLLEISSSGFRLFWVDQPCLAAQDVAREWARAAMSVVQISACLARAIGAGPAFQVSARWRAFDAEKALAELSLSSEGLESYPREQAFLNAIQGQLEGMALSAT